MQLDNLNAYPVTVRGLDMALSHVRTPASLLSRLLSGLQTATGGGSGGSSLRRRLQQAGDGGDDSSSSYEDGSMAGEDGAIAGPGSDSGGRHLGAQQVACSADSLLGPFLPLPQQLAGRPEPESLPASLTCSFRLELLLPLSGQLAAAALVELPDGGGSLVAASATTMTVSLKGADVDGSTEGASAQATDRLLSGVQEPPPGVSDPPPVSFVRRVPDANVTFPGGQPITINATTQLKYAYEVGPFSCSDITRTYQVGGNASRVRGRSGIAACKHSMPMPLVLLPSATCST